MNFKHIHIGSIIAEQVLLQQIAIGRICKFFGYPEEQIEAMYQEESLDCNDLLKWSKLLKYNLFLYYQNHLILYAPSGASISRKTVATGDSQTFRKNIYTQEIKDYMIGLVLKKGKEPMWVAEKYHIPKNTIYRWLKKNISKEEPKPKSHLSLKKNLIPNYKVIFEDLAKERYKDLIPKHIQDKINSLDNHLDVLELNRLIFNQNYSSKETAQMKAYDRASIEKILETQQKEKLNNREIALMFHLSRNTIAKWRKEYSPNPKGEF